MARVLIIDDDADLVEALKIALKARGYDVEAEPHGEAGLNAVRANRPDLVILDTMMKTKDEGLQVSYRLRHNPDTSAIPILLLAPPGAQVGFRFTPDDGDFLVVDLVIEKPVRPMDILLAVDRMMGKKGGNEAGRQKGAR